MKYKIEDRLPKAFQLVFIKRKSGNIYLGHRGNDKPLVENDDYSRDCYWWGTPTDDLNSNTTHRELRFSYNFQDGTVDSWIPLEVPDLAINAQKERGK